MLKQYPRPEFRRSHSLKLNGEWNFIFDDNKEGEKERWLESHFVVKVDGDTAIRYNEA